MTAAPVVPLSGTTPHLDALAAALREVAEHTDRLRRWAEELADTLSAGGRLLAVGNGGSAAQAQHLTAELVGRYCDDRRPFSALALHADASSVTAIANDYGVEQVFDRQVRAHGRPGDVLLALSTSGRSGNVVAAVRSARGGGLRTWALTGPAPNPLFAAADDAVVVSSESTPTVQEVHLVVIHILCEFLDQVVCR